MTQPLSLSERLTIVDGMRNLRQYWHPVAAVDDLAEGPVASTLLGEDLVVYRSGDEIVALQDLCVHRGSRLSMGTVDSTSGCIVCPYHAWEYDTSGKCTYIPSQPRDAQHIPPKARVPKYHTSVHYGLVWVALDEPIAPVPLFPPYEDPEWTVIMPGVWTWNASPGRFVENAIDISHLAIVHAEVILPRDQTVVGAFDLRDDDRGYTFTLRRIDAEGGNFGAAGSEIGQQTWVELPFSWRLLLRAPGLETSVYIAIQPIAPDTFRFWEYVAWRGEQPMTVEQLTDVHRLIIEQDRAIVESQRPELLPLDITAELHVKEADVPCIEYRRRLAKVVDGPYA